MARRAEVTSRMFIPIELCLFTLAKEISEQGDCLSAAAGTTTYYEYVVVLIVLSSKKCKI